MGAGEECGEGQVEVEVEVFACPMASSVGWVALVCGDGRAVAGVVAWFGADVSAVWVVELERAGNTHLVAGRADVQPRTCHDNHAAHE